MSLLGRKMMRHRDTVFGYLEAKSGISVLLLDSELNIRDCNQGFVALLGIDQKPVGFPASNFLALDDANPPLASEMTLPFSQRTGFSGYLHCRAIPTEDGCLLFCERLSLTESKAIELMAQLNNELLVIQRALVQKNLLLDKLNRDLEASHKQLQMQHETLQCTFHRLEQEAAARVQAVQELRKREQMLIQQNRMAATGEMLSNLAHQWRQPLNNLGLKIQEIGLSYRFGVLDAELFNANQQESLKILNHLSQTIDTLRGLAMADLEKKPFRVDQVVEKTVLLVKDNLQGQGIKLWMKICGEPSINGYPNEYAQVLLNLLMNARDALQGRKVAEPWIYIYCCSEEGKSVVTITDNAGGIEREILDKIFDAFFTTKALGKGTGIGLFLSKTIIEKKMGGRLTVQNAESGAEFRIEI